MNLSVNQGIDRSDTPVVYSRRISTSEFMIAEEGRRPAGNAGTYLALRMQWRRNQPPWPWKSRWFAGAKTGISEWSFCGTVRETVNESQILITQR